MLNVIKIAFFSVAFCVYFAWPEGIGLIESSETPCIFTTTKN